MARTMTIGTIFRAVDQMSKPLRTMGLQSDKMAARMKRSFSGVASTLRTIRKIATIAFAAVGISASLMIGTVTRDFLNFDNAVLSSAAKFSDLDLSAQSGIDTFKRMQKAARDVGATTKFTAAEAAEGLNYLAMAGFSAEQAIVALPETSNLAIVANTDLARATDITTDSLGAFNLMADDTVQLQKNLARVNDVYAKTVNTSNTNLDNLFEAVKKGAPTFTAAGQRMETFAALAGVMANSGVKGAEAGTALRNVMLRLSKPTGEASKYLRRLGVTTSDENGNFRDAIDILADLEKGLAGMGTQQRAAALSTIFGARAVTSVNVLLSEGTKGLQEYRDSLDASTGTADKMAAVIGQSLTNRLLGLKSAATEVGFQFMEAFDTQAGTAIDNLTEKLRNFDVQPTIDALVKGGNDISAAWESGLIPTVLKVSGAFIGLKLAIGIISTLAIAVGGLNTAIGFLLANPVVALIGLAVLTIGGSLYLLTKDIDHTKAVFKGFYLYLKYIASKIAAPFKPAFDKIASYFEPFQKSIDDLKQAFKDGDLLAGMKAFGESIFNFLFAPFKMVWDVLYKISELIVKVFEKPFENMIENILDFFKNPSPTPSYAPSAGGYAPAVTTPQGLVDRQRDWYANNPVSPNAGVIESNTTNTETSKVEVEFINPPAGTQVRQDSRAPNLILNPGTRAW